MRGPEEPGEDALDPVARARCRVPIFGLSKGILLASSADTHNSILGTNTFAWCRHRSQYPINKPKTPPPKLRCVRWMPPAITPTAATRTQRCRLTGRKQKRGGRPTEVEPPPRGRTRPPGLARRHDRGGCEKRRGTPVHGLPLAERAPRVLRRHAACR
jgi:hypothetical protein